MRIHSDTLSKMHLIHALQEAGLQYEGVHLNFNGTHGSRSHHRAFEVTLRATPGKDRNGKVRRWPNGGSYGADTGYGKAATYDEWGYFIAEVYRKDPDAKVGPYDNLADFTRQTRGAYSMAIADLA
jgi:hypothetical protein